MDGSGDDGRWLAFRAALEAAIGVPLGDYREPQMRRRLGSMMARRGFANWSAFAEAIAGDGTLLADVRNMLTINVSEFFRQPERFEDLRTRVLPELLAGGRAVRVWSAGCSIGCEPYSLAMLLDELDPGGASRVIATDIGMPALARARAGQGYLPAEVRNVPPATLARYFEQAPDGTYAVTEPARRRVVFRRHDLLSDAYPSSIDLLLCRNVVIYFTEAAKRRIYAGFASALSPRGYLFVGGSEMIMRPQELGLRAAATSLYRLAA